MGDRRPRDRRHLTGVPVDGAAHVEQVSATPSSGAGIGREPIEEYAGWAREHDALA